METILIVNGPNLNMLGKREKNIYGLETLEDIKNKCELKCKKLNLNLQFIQDNIEGNIINHIHNAYNNNYVGVIINAGAYTHTSIAILDALKVLTCPIIEIHISNIFQREEFRHNSYISKVANGIISGFGVNTYLLALDAMANLINPNYA